MSEKIIGELREVHEQRFENICQKSRPTSIIFSSEAMERFARTGMESDHFFALRPYTGEERAQILGHILKQMKENPAFHVYFFKKDFAPPLMEVTLFEGEGTLMTKPFTDYNLADDHAEVLITSDAFCAHYKAFFTGDLLARHVMGPEETETELERLIEIAKEG